MSTTSNPSRPHRGLPAIAWAAATIIFLASVVHHYVERYQRPVRERSIAAIESWRNHHGIARNNSALNPLFKALINPNVPAAGPTPITPEYVEGFLRPYGMVSWQSKSFPLQFTFIDPATRFPHHVSITAKGNFAGHGGGGFYLERVIDNKFRQERSALFRQLTVWALRGTIALMVIGVVLFSRPYRWLYESIFIAALITIALRIAAITYGGRPLTHGIDDYPWLLLVASVLWFASAKRHAVAPDPGRCGQCDYDLTGNVSGVCPECGTPIPAESNDGAGPHPDPLP